MLWVVIVARGSEVVVERRVLRREFSVGCCSSCLIGTSLLAFSHVGLQLEFSQRTRTMGAAEKVRWAPGQNSHLPPGEALQQHSCVTGGIPPDTVYTLTRVLDVSTPTDC